MKYIQELERAGAEGEPLYLLTGRSKYGAIGMRAVAEAMAADGVDPAKVRVAREHALEMGAWPVEQDVDIVVPPEPEIERPKETYGKLEKPKK